MSKINSKFEKNASSNNTHYGSYHPQHLWNYRPTNDSNMRNYYPSDFAPRKICQICGDDFRIINDEGFAIYDVRVCRQCICSMVRDKVAEQKRLAELSETKFNARLDDISTQ